MSMRCALAGRRSTARRRSDRIRRPARRNPTGFSAPSPNRNFSISASRIARCLGSSGERRFSLISMVWCASQRCQAGLPTCSNTRLPSSPGQGTKSRPSVSRLVDDRRTRCVACGLPGCGPSSSLRIGAGRPSVPSRRARTQRRSSLSPTRARGCVPRQRSGCDLQAVVAEAHARSGARASAASKSAAMCSANQARAASSSACSGSDHSDAQMPVGGPPLQQHAALRVFDPQHQCAAFGQRLAGLRCGQLGDAAFAAARRTSFCIGHSTQAGSARVHSVAPRSICACV